MTYCIDSVPTKLFADRDAMYHHGRGGMQYVWGTEPGVFPQDVLAVILLIPAMLADGEFGEHDYVTVRIPTDPANPHRWVLSGTAESPTLAPSIDTHGIWHGWLTAGILKSC